MLAFTAAVIELILSVPCCEPFNNNVQQWKKTPKKYYSVLLSNLLNNITTLQNILIQGDHSSCVKPPIDIKT